MNLIVDRMGFEFFVRKIEWWLISISYKFPFLFRMQAIAVNIRLVVSLDEIKPKQLI